METFQCPACELKFRFPSELDDHMSADHPTFQWRPSSSAGALFGGNHRPAKRGPRYLSTYTPAMSSRTDKMVATEALVGISARAEAVRAAELMALKEVGALGVYTPDGVRLIGLITERDITNLVAHHYDPETTTVETIMTQDPVIVLGALSVDEAARLMLRSHIRHLIVRDGGEDRIVSIRDVIDPAKHEVSIR